MLRLEIEWLDSGLSNDTGWMSKIEAVESSRLSNVLSIGYLLHEDDECYILVRSSALSFEKYYGVQVIAKKNVVSVKRLRER